MLRKPQGVISYAGLDVPTLLAGARLMFTSGEDQLPRRFASLMPLLPMELIQSMPFVGVAQPGANVAPGGFSIDPAEYHCMLYQQMPRLYVGDNLVRNTDAEGVFHGRGVVTVDEAWTTCFPQYQPFQGERLTIYPLGGGAQAAAVPESLYPRAAGFLRTAETALGITRRCHDYAHYVYQRIRSGHTFDADAFENDYLEVSQLSPVTICQSDLGRLMQDISMLKNAREGTDTDGLYTENAKRAEHILQYVPGLYACDVFEDTPITRYTARLVQPVWEDGFVSDWWLPYGDAAAYAAADRQTLDMAALCQGFQLAPVYDPQTRGGRYPDKVRVVILRDRELRLRIADTLNNPAYGTGMSPAGAINKIVYLQNSRELLRQGRLALEEDHFRCENTSVPPAAYRAMVAKASVQEVKGQLVDALYRRESVLSEVRDTSPDHDRLHALMNQPVGVLEARLSGQEKAQLSGYDADLDYLRRMGMEREWKPGPKKQKTFRFAPDTLRQASIESGFAMRTACMRCDWASLALPPQADDAADDPGAGLSASVTPSEASAMDTVETDTVSSSGDDQPRWLDYAGELLHPAEPPLPPMWLNAADPCCLTTDAGGLYPTDEELAASGGEPPTAEMLQAIAAKAAGSPDPAPDAKPDKPKAKKAAKGSKKGARKGSKVQPSDGRTFSDEEMERRQVVLELPISNDAAATESIPAAADASADAAATNTADAANAAVPTDDTSAAVTAPEAVPAAADETATASGNDHLPETAPAFEVAANTTNRKDTPEPAANAESTAASAPEIIPVATNESAHNADTDNTPAAAPDTAVATADHTAPDSAPDTSGTPTDTTGIKAEATDAPAPSTGNDGNAETTPEAIPAAADDTATKASNATAPANAEPDTSEAANMPDIPPAVNAFSAATYAALIEALNERQNAAPAAASGLPANEPTSADTANAPSASSVGSTPAASPSETDASGSAAPTDTPAANPSVGTSATSSASDTPAPDDSPQTQKKAGKPKKKSKKKKAQEPILGQLSFLWDELF
ncbi:MAG: hypothetical protein IJ041_06150 [Clostridia bacterium]|nr:hypothetical protein [Clostridia bacterium]